MKRVLKILGIGIGVLVLLVVVAAVLVALFVDLDKVVNDQIVKAKPKIEEKLGRKVAVGTVATRIFPVLGGSVADVAIAPDPTHPEDDRPLLKIKSVGFDIALWEALKSRGKSIVVTDLYVEGLQVNLVRYKGGRLSYQDILDRQPKEEPAAAAKGDSKPLSPEVLEYLRAVSVDALRVVDAEIRLADHDTPTGKLAEDYVRKLNLRLNDLRLSDPIRVKLEAAVFAEKPNFELETTVGPLPQDLDFKGLPHIAGVKVRISDVDLGKVTPYLGPAVPVKVASALLSTQWDVGEVSLEKPVTVAGSLAVRQLQLVGGQKFDLSLEAKAKADLKNIGMEIEKLQLKVGTVELAMSGALLDLAKVPRFKDFTVRSTTLDLDQLLAYYPAAAKSLPPGSKLEGIATLDARASGDAGKQTVVAGADLSALHVLIPGTFVKPKGTPLKLSVNGEFTASDANLRQLGLVLDELDLGVKGTVKNFDKPTLDLTLAAKPFSFDRIVRLLPQAGQALTEQNAKASGDGSIAGHVKGTLTDLDAAFDLSLTGVKLDIPDTHLDGALTVSVAVVGNPKRDLRAAVVVDADKAVIKIKDTLDKTAATPMLVQLDADRRGELVTLKRLSVLFAELKLDATGTFDLGKGTTALNVSMPRVDLEKLSKTVTAIPADKAKKAFFDANIGVVGNPNKLETMAVELTSLDVRIGRSDLQGTVKIANLVKPRAQIDVRSQLLDLDELQGSQAATKPAAPGGPSQPGPKTPPKDDPSLKDYRFTGKVDLKRVIVSKTELTDVKGDLELVDGVLTLKQCNLRAFDGNVSATGTRAEIWKGRMPFTANLTVKGLDMNKVLSSKTQYANSLHGKADLDLKASGEGFETAELEQKLLGSLRLGLIDGKLTKASLTQSVLGGFTALDKVPGVQTQKVAKAIVSDNAIKNLAAAIDIRDGKLNLSKPLNLNLDGNKVVLGGAIGIGGKLFLTGDYYVPASLVNQLTSNKCKATSDLRVPVAINGTITAPEFRPNAEPVIAGLLQACLQGEVGKQVQDVAKKEGEKLLKGLFK
ncbi:MAG TPA: AsmA family protein [Myxococcales bacterium]|jgi:AsmA protein